MRHRKGQRAESGERVAVGYCRVSTPGQASEGISLDAQRQRIEAWATANGYRLLAVHVDAGLSGRRADNRPGLQTAMREACRQKASLVAYSLSRLARSVPDAYTLAGQLERSRANLVLLSEAVDTTTAAGRMFFGMLALLAQFESDLTSERTAAAMAHLREQGVRIGTVPFGRQVADDGRTLKDHPAEREVIARIQALRREGATFRGIVQRLNDDLVPARGSRWHLRSVQLVLAANPA